MTETPQTPAGPGWYDDPQDPTLLRYFDGILWTAHTTPRQSPTAQASTIGRATPGPQIQGQPGWGQPPGQPGGWGQPGAPGQQGPGQWSGGQMPAGGPGGYGQSWAQPRKDILPDGAVLAQWWRRLVARIIDWFVTGLITLAVAFPWVRQAMSAFTDFLTTSMRAAESGAAPPSQAEFTEQLLQVALPITLVSVAVSLVYEVAFLATRGATPGKMVLGTVVRRVQPDAGKLTVVDALKRQVIAVGTSLLGLLPLLSLFGSGLSILDPAWLLWDPKRQALHDKVADTVVVLRNPQR